LSIPYIPTFLAYREVDSYERLYTQATRRHANQLPHILMVDGNGTLHPRGFGCACLVGYRLNCPTIGVAKNLLETVENKFTDPSLIRPKWSVSDKVSVFSHQVNLYQRLAVHRWLSCNFYKFYFTLLVVTFFNSVPHSG
uniref:Endonuclease V n=1 Tax=Echinostoma caproni TaxID=27848 RepID=A0A183A1L3_9TREM